MNDQQKQENIEARINLLTILTDHVGQSRAIGMGELYTAVYGEPWKNRINDTRRLRLLITELREEGRPICSNKNGYWLASAGSETREYCKKLKTAALKKLKLAATISKISLPALLGQLQIDPPADK